MDKRVEFVKQRSGTTEFRLVSNGLRILLIPNKLGNVIAMMTHYNIGSRNEAPGHTGSTHFLEHLTFKGSKNFPGDEFGIDKMISKTGAQVNADTWFDRTGYWEIFTPEHLEFFMELEADRMRNATFSDDDRQNEMPIVRSELEIAENNPSELLCALVLSTAIQQHPYHWDTIGYRADVENVPTERLREFYNAFYYPNNAMIIVIGNFDEEEVLGAVLRQYGRIKPSLKPMPEIYTQEPPQEGERRVTLRQSGGNGIIQFAWMTPGASHPDFAALEVLSYMLSVGNRGLLKSKFVNSGRVAGVQTRHFALKDPFPFCIKVSLLRQNGHLSIERDVRKYLEALQRNGLTDEDLQRAKILAEAREWYDRDHISNMLSAFSIIEGAGGWELYYTIPDDIQKVTTADVMRVFQKYLVPNNLTVGWYIPSQAQPVTLESE